MTQEFKGFGKRLAGGFDEVFVVDGVGVVWVGGLDCSVDVVEFGVELDGAVELFVVGVWPFLGHCGDGIKWISNVMDDSDLAVHQVDEPAEKGGVFGVPC